ncbi:sensor domain CHASE-containing protein [Methanohalophilus levihalophilus]|uniref:CHASE4 domain-containing protein n=1 Tax=Methanohalophilus levihalophilus TaxID=1431282 RepID=UPI001AE58658|nr:CHASE4 domain-containing protein [Methanohalophilus levihalophilus]MBP2031310.1 sensor domain CHASE-containing protein [Methanohalophilus levihalophilus]
MEIHKKTLLILGITIITLIIVLFLSAQAILISGFADLELQDTEQNLERVKVSISNEYTRLGILAYDWGAWDDTYEFVEDHNEEYIDSNLVDSTFYALDVNAMLYVNSSGYLVYGKAMDLENEEEVPIPPELYDMIYEGSFILDHPDTESSISGILLFPENPMIVFSRPILTSNDEGPIRGTLILCRYLDSAKIEELSENTQLSLDVHRFNDSSNPLDVQVAQSSLLASSSVFIQPLSEQSIAGYTVINDIYGDPALVLRVNLPRGIYEQGQSTIILPCIVYSGCRTGVWGSDNDPS